MPQKLTIDAVIVDAERAAFIAAAEQLRECLGRSLGSEPDVVLRFHDAARSVASAPPGDLVILSLLRDALGTESLDRIESRLRAVLDAPTKEPVPVFLCTV